MSNSDLRLLNSENLVEVLENPASVEEILPFLTALGCGVKSLQGVLDAPLVKAIADKAIDDADADVRRHGFEVLCNIAQIRPTSFGETVVARLLDAVFHEQDAEVRVAAYDWLRQYVEQDPVTVERYKLGSRIFESMMQEEDSDVFETQAMILDQLLCVNAWRAPAAVSDQLEGLLTRDKFAVDIEMAALLYSDLSQQDKNHLSVERLDRLVAAVCAPEAVEYEPEVARDMLDTRISHLSTVYQSCAEFGTEKQVRTMFALAKREVPEVALSVVVAVRELWRRNPSLIQSAYISDLAALRRKDQFRDTLLEVQNLQDMISTACKDELRSTTDKVTSLFAAARGITPRVEAQAERPAVSIQALTQALKKLSPDF